MSEISPSISGLRVSLNLLGTNTSAEPLDGRLISFEVGDVIMLLETDAGIETRRVFPRLLQNFPDGALLGKHSFFFMKNFIVKFFWTALVFGTRILLDLVSWRSVPGCDSILCSLYLSCDSGSAVDLGNFL